MKIDGVNVSPITGVRDVNKVTRAANGSPAGNDGITVSRDAQVFQVLLKKAAQISTFQQDRVQSLREQIANGQFQVDAQKVAQKMLDTRIKG